MTRRPPRSTRVRSSAASDVYKRQASRSQGREANGAHRVMMESAVHELRPLMGTRPACRALGVAPATIYRRRRPPVPRASQPRPLPARALSTCERDAVLAELHGERFLDTSPAALVATLLDEGRYTHLRAH